MHNMYFEIYITQLSIFSFMKFQNSYFLFTQNIFTLHSTRCNKSEKWGIFMKRYISLHAHVCTYGAASKVNFCELSLHWQIPPKTKVCIFAQDFCLSTEVYGVMG